MFVVGDGQGGEQKQNDGQGENNQEKRWFLVCEADYMNLNNTGDDPQPINLMREEYPTDQYYYYSSCDDENRDHPNDDDYSSFFNVNNTQNSYIHNDISFFAAEEDVNKKLQSDSSASDLTRRINGCSINIYDPPSSDDSFQEKIHINATSLDKNLAGWSK